VLTPQAEGLLAELAPALADRATGRVAIEGHTDAVGDAAYNQDLSTRRAEAVRAWLAGPGGLSQLSFEVLGLGETQPIVPETRPDGADDPEGRARNRRVTIRYQTSAGSG
jgi:outer membrane protein OmpA-like peptidoglycan-associated protein